MLSCPGLFTDSHYSHSRKQTGYCTVARLGGERHSRSINCCVVSPVLSKCQGNRFKATSMFRVRALFVDVCLCVCV